MGADDWDDPHDLVPEAFREAHPEANSVVEALETAQGAPTTTPKEEQDRCPRCGSRNISSKSYKRENHKRIETDYKCNRQGCRYHFDTPADENTIPMTDERTDAFDWIARDELLDRDRRSSLDPPFADVDRDSAVAIAILLRAPWRNEADRRKYPEIARYLPFEDSWVGHRVREWNDGEHRDLVREPVASADATPEEPTPDEGGEPAVADGGRGTRRWSAFGN